MSPLAPVLGGEGQGEGVLEQSSADFPPLPSPLPQWGRGSKIAFLLAFFVLSIPPLHHHPHGPHPTGHSPNSLILCDLPCGSGVGGQASAGRGAYLFGPWSVVRGPWSAVRGSWFVVSWTSTTEALWVVAARARAWCRTSTGCHPTTDNSERSECTTDNGQQRAQRVYN